MEIPVLIEPIEGSGYRASVLSLTAKGATEGEALERFKALLDERLAAGARLVCLEVPAEKVAVAAPNPWLAGFGMFRDDPLFDEWQEAIREYRLERDAEDEAAESAKAA